MKPISFAFNVLVKCLEEAGYKPGTTKNEYGDNKSQLACNGFNLQKRCNSRHHSWRRGDGTRN